MIGQRELLKKIDGQIERGKFPKVSVLIGEKGSGRKTLARHISRKMNEENVTSFDVITVVPTLQDINETYKYLKNGFTGFCIFDNFDFVPDSAEYTLISLLEYTKSEFKDIYFIFTCEDFENLPQKIKDNAVSYSLEPYYDDDKFDFLYKMGINNLNRDDEEFVIDTASNLSDIESLCALDIRDFKKYVNFVLDNLVSDAFIPSANASKIAFNEEDDKFPMRIFLKAFMTICGDRMRIEGNSLMYCRFIAITGDTLQRMIGDSSDNKKVFDVWEATVRFEYKKFRG